MPDTFPPAWRELAGPLFNYDANVYTGRGG